MPPVPRLKAYSIVKVIICYELMKSENEKIYEELLYLIKGVQKTTIGPEDFKSPGVGIKYLPKMLWTLMDKGYFKRQGNNKSRAYITEAGRDRLGEILGELQQSAKKIRFKRKEGETWREKYRSVIERKGKDWRQVKFEEMKEYKNRNRKKKE